MPAGLGALLLVRFFDEAVSFLPAGAAEAIRVDVGLTYTQIGVLLSVPAAGALLGNVFAVAADHRSRRVIAGGGALALAGVLALFAGAASFWMLVVAAFAYGAAATAMVDGAEVALVDATRPGRLRAVLARANLFGALGDLAGPVLLAGAVALGLGWRGSFAVGAVALAAYGWWLAASPLPEPRCDGDPGADSRVEEAEGPAGRSKLWRDGRVWRLGLISLLIGPLDEALLGFLIAYLQQGRGLSQTTATLAGGAFVVGGILAYTVVAPRLHQRSDRSVLVASAVAMAVSLAVVVGVPATWVIVPAGLAFDVGLSCGWLVLQHQALTLVPGRAGTVGAMVSTIEMGGAVIPLLIGVVADRYGLAAGLWGFALLPVAVAGLAARLRAEL